MAFICGNCKGRHDLVEQARDCYGIFECVWLVQEYGEDGPYERECGALAIETDRGFACVAGHSHVYADVRAREGWTYAEDPFEAKSLMRAGIFPMAFDGSGPAEIAP